MPTKGHRQGHRSRADGRAHRMGYPTAKAEAKPATKRYLDKNGLDTGIVVSSGRGYGPGAAGRSLVTLKKYDLKRDRRYLEQKRRLKADKRRAQQRDEQAAREWLANMKPELPK